MEKKQENNEIKLDIIGQNTEHAVYETNKPKENTHIKKDEIKLKINFLRKIQFWQVLSTMFIILFVISLFIIFSSNGGISEAEAKNKIRAYVDNALAGRVVATIGEVSEKSGLYKVQITIQGQDIDSYITKDGELFFPTGVDLERINEMPGLPGNVARNVNDDNEISQTAKT